MEGGKKIAAIVVLLVVIVGGVGFTVKKYTSGPQLPERYLAKEHEKIDVTDGTLMTKTYREWRKLGVKGGRYKNPDTGQFTMAGVLTCGPCGEKIPAPEKPPTPARDDAKYECPKCGEPAYNPGKSTFID